MNYVLFYILNISFTGWKIFGYIGLIIFSSRWIIQLYSSKVHGQPIVPRSFWLLSVTGSVFLLVYFIFGKNDSVGTLSNLFPAIIALYNLFLDMKFRKKQMYSNKSICHDSMITSERTPS